MRRSPATNTLVVLGIVAFLVILGAIIWFRWDAAAQAGEAASGSDNAAVWGLIVVGGPIMLVGAIIWAKLRNRGATKAMDPGTPSDDPSKGMSGHD